MNVNKRKVDAPNGPAPAAPSSPSGSRNTTVPASQGGPRHGLPAPPASLPPRPVTGAASTSTGAATTTPLANRQGDRQAPPHIKDRLAPSPKPIAATGEQPTNGSRTSSGLSAGPDVDDSVQRSSKRARTDGQRGGRSDAPPMQSVWSVGTPSTEEPHPAPSLLSRLNSGSLNGKAPSGPLNEREQPTRGRGGQGVRNRGEVERGRNVTDAVVPAKRRAELTTPSTAEPPVMASDSAAQSVSTRSHQSQLPPDPDRDPIGGYSIRGAAKAAKRSSPAGSDSVGTKVAATSLLHRLQPLGEQGAGQGSDEGGGKRPRKKGRHA
ncbi:hypothetical protein BD414DRAFT_482795 [Trametes punicea]|nr:hypothetical protein BD414DRAFT_482795 [Trametes punicea]